MTEKKKIAFVVARYGTDVNGGGEVHCRMLAERLLPYYEVDVLTTTIKDWERRTDDYSPGTETLHGVTVRRFEAAPEKPEKFMSYKRKAKWARKIRHRLYRWGWLEKIASWCPQWTFRLSAETRFLRSYARFSDSHSKYILHTPHG